MLKLSRDRGYQMGSGGQWQNTFKCCLFTSICIKVPAQTLTSAWGMETSFWGILGPTIISHTSRFQLDLHFTCPTLAMTRSLGNKHLGDSTVTCLWKRIRVYICMVEFCQLEKPCNSGYMFSCFQCDVILFSYFEVLQLAYISFLRAFYQKQQFLHFS